MKEDTVAFLDMFRSEVDTKANQKVPAHQGKRPGRYSAESHRTVGLTRGKLFALVFIEGKQAF